MMKNRLITILAIQFLILAASLFNIQTAFANEALEYQSVDEHNHYGGVESISIQVDGLGTPNYTIDIIAGSSDEHSMERQINSETKGNAEHENHFYFLGSAPEDFKIVVINNDTGKVKRSGVIHRKASDDPIIIDYNGMMTTRVIATTGYFIRTIVVAMVAAGIGLGIALLVKIKKWVTILAVNFLAIALLQLAFAFIPIEYFITLVVGELIIILAELGIYSLAIKDIGKREIIKYTVISNIAIALLIILTLSFI